MASSLHLEVVTPDRAVLDTTVDYVGVPGVAGQFGVLAGHIPMLSALDVGTLYYRVEGKEVSLFIAGGFAEVSENRVSILAESAELAEEIDVDRAQKARQRAEERLHAKSVDVDVMRAQAALKRAIARMHVRGL